MATADPIDHGDLLEKNRGELPGILMELSATYCTRARMGVVYRYQYTNATGSHGSTRRVYKQSKHDIITSIEKVETSRR